MATEKKAPATKTTVSGRQAGKTTQQKAAIDKAVAAGKRVTVRTKAGDTVIEPAKTRSKTAPAAKKAPAKKRAAKGTTRKVGEKKDSGKRPRKPIAEIRAMGRPTLYRPEYPQAMLTYFQVEASHIEIVKVPDGKGGVIDEEKIIVNKFPTLTRFAQMIGVSRDTMHSWATSVNKDGSLSFPEFSDAYVRARDAQESLLTEGGLEGLYDSRFAVFTAKNLIGWKDQIEQVIAHNVTAVSNEALDELYAAKMEEMERAEAAAIARGNAINGIGG